MPDQSRQSALRIVLLVVGLVFIFGVYPLKQGVAAR